MKNCVENKRLPKKIKAPGGKSRLPRVSLGSHYGQTMVLTVRVISYLPNTALCAFPWIAVCTLDQSSWTYWASFIGLATDRVCSGWTSTRIHQLHHSHDPIHPSPANLLTLIRSAQHP